MGGLEDFVSNLARMQRTRDVDVGVVTLDRNFQTGEKLPARERWQGIDVVRVPWLGSRRYPIAPGVLRHLRDADIVHVHAIDFFVDYLALLKALRLLPQPVVVSTHGGIFHTDQQLALKRLFFHSVSRLSLNRLERVVCCSVGDVATFAAIRGDLKLIENGIALQKFGAAEGGRAGEGLLYVGRLSDNKNLPGLMRAVDRTNRVGSPRPLCIVGRSNSGDVAALRAAHAGLEQPQWVELALDVDDAAIRERIRRSRFVISASRHEGFGLTVPELMSYGLVPLLNDIPPFRHFVEQSGCGLLFDGGAVLEALLRQLPDGAAFDEASARAERFAATLRWDVVQEHFMEVYRGLLA
jgi:alpha-1,3-mannosyltransferase